jgi:hypothetical protein
VDSSEAVVGRENERAGEGEVSEDDGVAIVVVDVIDYTSSVEEKSRKK